jgi:hypothetical protein
MDPYLESPALWPDVHMALMNTIREIITPQVVPKHFVGVERRIHLLDETDQARRQFVPEVTIHRTGEKGGLAPVQGAKPAHVELITVFEPIEVRESRLVIRQVGGDKVVVTAIEVLSPSNKTPGSHGRGEYIAKRDEVLHSAVNLVEIDLLRGGARLPSPGGWPECDYLAHISRPAKRPRGDVFFWGVRDPLPEIPIPLAAGDPDATLDLSRALRETYERARYDVAIDYAAPLQPPLKPEDAAWAKELLGKRA